MADKLHKWGGESSDGSRRFAFQCPGCGSLHSFTVGGEPNAHPRWTWNGSMEAPTFSPSLLCNKDFPESRCHSFVENGKIRFLGDFFHALANRTVDLPDWDSR